MSRQIQSGQRQGRHGAGDRELSALTRSFRALSDPTRLRILALLGTGELCVCHIHTSLGIPQSKASRHLAYLRRAGFVRARKRGLWVHYAIAEPAGVAPLLASLTSDLARTEIVRNDCCRLADALEREGPEPGKRDVKAG